MTRVGTFTASRWAAVVFGGLVAVILSAGCSTFDRDFEVAVAHGPYTDITGPWEGRWKSQVDDHGGRLRCLLSQVGENDYKGRFQARYFGIFTFEHELPMTAAAQDGAMIFQGRANLPLYGPYDWSGQIAGDEFTAEYRSEKDHGTFTMTRPGRPLPAEQQ